jgi:hypothetical protein
MPASYPAATYAPRTKQNKSGIVYDATKKTVLFADDITNVDVEVVAIETELGTNPKGSKSDVKTRLDDIDTALASKADITNEVGIYQSFYFALGIDLESTTEYYLNPVTGGESGASIYGSFVSPINGVLNIANIYVFTDSPYSSSELATVDIVIDGSTYFSVGTIRFDVANGFAGASDLEIPIAIGASVDVVITTPAWSVAPLGVKYHLNFYVQPV